MHESKSTGQLWRKRRSMVKSNVLREYNGMKEEIKNPETSVEYTI